MTDLQERLKRALVSHKLMQKEFAEQAGVLPTTVSNILMGRDPRYSTYAKVDAALRRLEGPNDLVAR